MNKRIMENPREKGAPTELWRKNSDRQRVEREMQTNGTANERNPQQHWGSAVPIHPETGKSWKAC